MKIFKFGGASVKDANGVKNILNVLKHTGFDNTLIVVSAMGKPPMLWNAWCLLSLKIKHSFQPT